jgi:hypothetical protein
LQTPLCHNPCRHPLKFLRLYRGNMSRWYR